MFTPWLTIIMCVVLRAHDHACCADLCHSEAAPLLIQPSDPIKGGLASVPVNLSSLLLLLLWHLTLPAVCRCCCCGTEFLQSVAAAVTLKLVDELAACSISVAAALFHNSHRS